MYWLMERNCSLSLHNKLIAYKQILKPVCTYRRYPTVGLHQTK
jgi:hypothetical protein